MKTPTNKGIPFNKRTKMFISIKPWAELVPYIFIKMKIKAFTENCTKTHIKGMSFCGCSVFIFFFVVLYAERDVLCTYFSFSFIMDKVLFLYYCF